MYTGVGGLNWTQMPTCCTGGVFEELNPFVPTVPTFAVRETDVFRHNGGTSGAPLNPSETIVLSEHYRL